MNEISKRARDFASVMGIALLLLAGGVGGAGAATFAPLAPDSLATKDVPPTGSVDSDIDPIVIDDMLFRRQPGLDAAFQGTLWPGGDVFYMWANGVDPDEQAAFLNAASAWAQVANVVFVPASSYNPNYRGDYILVVDSGPGGLNDSYVGRQGGSQRLRISTNGWTQRGVIMHEIGHALGLIHEHQRSDRDNFVTILEANIQDGFEYNFDQEDGSTAAGTYDFGSIMHYPACAISVDCPPAETCPCSRRTIEPLEDYADQVLFMGQRGALSALDAAGMASRYGATLCRTPTDLSPHNSQTCVSPAGQLRWDPIPSATRYRVQLATSSTFPADEIIRENFVTTESFDYAGLASGRWYFWRVQAQTPHCGFGAYSAGAAFMTQPSFVARTPTPLTPPAGATNQPIDGVLTCSAVPGATAYRFSIRCPQGESIAAGTRTGPSFGYHLDPGIYTWTVTAANDCETSLPSDPQLFTVLGGAACGVPTLVSPADGAMCQPRSAMTLRWQAVPGISSYVVEVDRGPGSGDTYEVTGTQFDYTRLDAGRTISWRVRTKCSCSTYSTARTFQVADDPPHRLDALLTPSDGARDLPLDGTLTWRATTGAAGYRVRLGPTCGSGDSVETSQATFDYSGLAQNTTYFWQVQARDSCGQWGEYGRCWDFRTAWLTGLDRVYLDADLRFVPGQRQVRIPLRMENLAPTSTVNVRLKTDDRRLRFTGWTLDGTRLAGAASTDVRISSNEINARLTFSPQNVCPPGVPAGDGVMLFALADVPDDAPLGGVLIDLIAADGRSCDGSSLQFTRFDSSVEIGDSTAGPGGSAAPAALMLLPAVPNPMAGETVIEFGLPLEDDVTVDVFTVAGRRIANLHRGSLPAGWTRRVWDGRTDQGERVAAGVYLVRLRGLHQVASRRVIVLP